MPVTVGDMESVSGDIIRLANQPNQGGYVCVANVHMLVTARLDPALRDVLHRATMVVSDGTPLVWNLRRQGFSQVKQVRGPELMGYLCRAVAGKDVPVFFYGGNEELIAELRDQVERVIPGIDIAGAEAAPLLPMHPTVDPDTLERIRASGAKIVFVSLGCPKQEFWMRAYSPHLDAMLIGVGQAFSITAGHLAEAPSWMREHGLEWLFRLVSEPKRLWRRYLVTNSLFIAFLMIEAVRKFMRGSQDDMPAPRRIDGGAH